MIIAVNDCKVKIMKNLLEFIRNFKGCFCWHLCFKLFQRSEVAVLCDCMIFDIYICRNVIEDCDFTVQTFALILFNPIKLYTG